MTTIAQVSTAMQQVLVETAAYADILLHYTRRPDKAKFTASTLVQTLVFGFLAHPAATLEQLSQSAARVGVPASPQAIDQRFSYQTAALLRTVLERMVEHAIATDPVAIPLLARFTGVFVHDGTTITLPDALADQWPGCGGRTDQGGAAAVKGGVQLDLLHGTLTALDLTAGRTHDATLPCQTRALPAGSLRLADLGFFNLKRFAALDRDGVYWLSKLKVQTTVAHPDAAPQHLLSFVRAHATRGYDGPVVVGATGQLTARLLIACVPEAVAQQRRRRMVKDANDRGQRVSQAALDLAAWTILITNIPDALLRADEALVLMKIRWQIELLFKLWKSHGQIDQWRTANPARILCELYAKLIAMVIQHWILVVSCWQYVDRSWTKAAQVIRDHAVELASAQACHDRWQTIITTIARVLQSTARMNTRKQRPNTYQLLLALTTTDNDEKEA